MFTTQKHINVQLFLAMFPGIKLQYEACTKNECCVTAGSEAVVFCDRALYAVELFDFL